MKLDGIAAEEPFRAVSDVSDAPWLEIIDARTIALLAAEDALGTVPEHGGKLPWRAPVPTACLIVRDVTDAQTLEAVAGWLGKYYPQHHHVRVVGPAATGEADALTHAVSDLARATTVGFPSALVVPAVDEIDNIRTFAGLMQLTRTLRAPGGCPWDREQTHASLKPHLLEEAYEVIDALDSGQPSLIAEELGDLLFQVTIHSQIAAEAGTFTIEDVISGIMTKLIGRHPHVFADLELSSAQDVRHAWESFKQREKPKRMSVMAEIPRGLPALPQSNLMQKRAAGVGFEWPGVEDVLTKVDEELKELRAELNGTANRERQREEFGDILFALVSVARHLKIDPEEALRLANRKFSGRFQQVEAQAKGEGKSLRELGPDEINAYWNTAKVAPPE